MSLHSEEAHPLEGPHCVPAQPAESPCMFFCAIFDPPCLCLVIQDPPQSPVKPHSLFQCPVFHPHHLGLVLRATLTSSHPGGQSQVLTHLLQGLAPPELGA